MKSFDIVTIVDNLGKPLTPAIVVDVQEVEGAEPSLDLVAPLIVGGSITSHTYKSVPPLERDPSGFYRWIPWDAEAFGDAPTSTENPSTEPAAGGSGSGDSTQGNA